MKTVLNYSGSAWVKTAATRYLYSDWNLIADYNDNVSSGVITLSHSYLWGLDLSGKMHGAGGVGGLLAIVDSVTGNIEYPVHDANGNIHGLTDRATGEVTAAYEYSPFGQTLREIGTYAQANPFRFSSKYTDNETDLVNFGRRHYNPALGRFLGRDPIEEKGGLHLYGFVGNNGINRWDYLGMTPTITTIGAGGVGPITTLLPGQDPVLVAQAQAAQAYYSGKYGLGNSGNILSGTLGFGDADYNASVATDSSSSLSVSLQGAAINEAILAKGGNPNTDMLYTNGNIQRAYTGPGGPPISLGTSNTLNGAANSSQTATQTTVLGTGSGGLVPNASSLFGSGNYANLSNTVGVAGIVAGSLEQYSSNSAVAIAAADFGSATLATAPIMSLLGYANGGTSLTQAVADVDVALIAGIAVGGPEGLALASGYTTLSIVNPEAASTAKAGFLSGLFSLTIAVYGTPPPQGLQSNNGYEADPNSPDYGWDVLGHF
jgi:RHS repeat-associated protein